MDPAGLWQLFWQTGHPGLWLAIREEEEKQQQAQPAAESLPGQLQI